MIGSETKRPCNPAPRLTALPGRVVMPFRDLVRRVRHSTLARNAGWLFAGQGLSFLVQGIYFLVLARLLGTTEYGKLAGVVALVAVVSQYSTLGSGLLFLRYVSPDRSRFPAYWGNILMSVGISGGLAFAPFRQHSKHLQLACFQEIP